MLSFGQRSEEHIMKNTVNDARAAKAKLLEDFETLRANAAVGITRVGGAYGIKVNIPKKLSNDLVFPESIDGVPIVVEVVGTVRARN